MLPEKRFPSSSTGILKKWGFSYAGCEPHFQQAFVRDRIVYCGNNESPKRLQAFDLYTGELKHYLDIEKDCGREACGCAPWISGDFIYFYAHGANKVYKLKRVGFSLEASWPAAGVSYVEAVANDDTFFYLPEATRVTKRRMDDGIIVAAFPISSVPKGILMVQDMLYFKTETRFYCLDKTNMRAAWSFALDFVDKGYSVPIYDHHHKLLYLSIAKGDWSGARYWKEGYVYAIEAAAKKIGWKKHYPSYATTQTLAYCNNRIFVPLHYSHGMEALNPQDGSTIWSGHYDNDYGWCSCSLDDKYIYRGSSREWEGKVQFENYYFQIIRQADGKLIHQEPVKHSGVCAIAIISGGMCVLPTRGALVGFKVGAGQPVDYYPYHGNLWYSGHVPDAVTAYDF